MPSGLRPTQYTLLRHLRRLGPVSVSDLAAAIRLDRTTLVRKIKVLENESLIVDVSQKGSRNRKLELSELGIERLKDADLLWNKAQDFVESHLGNNNLEILTELLILIENLELVAVKRIQGERGDVRE